MIDFVLGMICMIGLWGIFCLVSEWLDDNNWW